MRMLSATEMLSLWESGLAQSPVQRALLLLGAACHELPPERLASIPIGQRDAQLLSLRERLFGPQLTSLTNCPVCAESLELQLNIADIRAPSAANPDESFELKTGDFSIAFRLPNSRDLEQLDPSTDLAANRRRLLEQCVLAAQHNAKEIPARQLPEEIVQAIASRMAEADRQADMQLALRCPQCAHEWEAPLDIVSFLWTEIHAWAMRLLREIHVLASAYGWREADILALSPWRRQAYLELIQS